VKQFRSMVSPIGGRRATAHDVAERAGRSLSTVSLVINGKDQGRVAAATRDRVLAAAAELGYRLNTTASALARGERDSIGFGSDQPPSSPWCWRAWPGTWTARSRDRADTGPG